jgi:dual specificity phosphatase 3
MFFLSFITDNLATSGQINEASDVRELLAAGVDHVLDLQETTSDARWLAGLIEEANWHRRSTGGPQIHYLHNGTPDDGAAKPTSWFKASMDFALPVLAPAFKNGGKVLAHCHAGYNRGPSTCYFLLRCLGWTPWQAWLRVKLKRPITFGGGMRYWRDAEAALKELGIP